MGSRKFEWIFESSSGISSDVVDFTKRKWNSRIFGGFPFSGVEFHDIGWVSLVLGGLGGFFFALSGFPWLPAMCCYLRKCQLPKYIVCQIKSIDIGF